MIYKIARGLLFMVSVNIYTMDIQKEKHHEKTTLLHTSLASAPLNNLEKNDVSIELGDNKDNISRKASWLCKNSKSIFLGSRSAIYFLGIVFTAYKAISMFHDMGGKNGKCLPPDDFYKCRDIYHKWLYSCLGITFGFISLEKIIDKYTNLNKMSAKSYGISSLSGILLGSLLAVLIAYST